MHVGSADCHRLRPALPRELQLYGLETFVEGDPSLLTVEEVSKMKSSADLLGELAMLISSPGRAVAGCLSAPQSKIAGCLEALIDRAA